MDFQDSVSQRVMEIVAKMGTISFFFFFFISFVIF